MIAARTWPSAPQAVNAIMLGKQLAEHASSHLPITYDALREPRNTTLSCCIFGCLPPPCLTCLISCTISSFTGTCLKTDCKDKEGCRSNQEGGVTPFHFAHHKASIGRQHARPMVFTLPAELAALLQLHLLEGCPTLFSQGAPHIYHFLTKLRLSNTPHMMTLLLAYA